MYKLHRILFPLFFLQLIGKSTLVFSQNIDKDSINIKTLPNTQINFDVEPIPKALVFDSNYNILYQNQQLTHTLKFSTPVFIRDYSANGLSTLQINGNPGRFSKIIWNGMPLNSSANGVVDMNLLAFSSQINLELYDASNPILLYSGGGIGGNLVMNNKKEIKNNHLGLVSSIGSFGRREFNVSGAYKHKKHQLYASAYTNSAENNFSYKNTFKNGTPTEKLQNAQSQIDGFQFKYDYLISDSASFNISHHSQKSDRNLPTPIFRNYSYENQTDLFHRTVINYQKKTKNQSYLQTLGFISEQLNYTDSLAGIFSSYRFNRFWYKPEVEGSIKLKKSDIIDYQFAFNILHDVTYNTGFDSSNVSQTRVATPLSLSKQNRNLSLNVQIRPELINVENFFVAQSYKGTYYHPTTNSNIQLTYSRLFNFPDMNDLYWIPGGNPDLTVEKNQTLSLSLSKNWRLHSKLNAFSKIIANRSNTKDAIVWQPKVGTNIWEAQQINNLSNLSITFSQKIDFRTRKNSILNSQLNYTFTQTEDMRGQLLYIPQNQFNLLMGYSKINRWSTFLELLYQGERLFDYGNQNTLSAYFLTNLSFVYQVDNPYFETNILLSANNVLNTTYQITQWQPMPGRNFRLTLDIKI